MRLRTTYGHPEKSPDRHFGAGEVLKTRKPRASARTHNSSSRELFPILGAPEIRTAIPFPAWASLRQRLRISSSESRPTSGGLMIPSLPPLFKVFLLVVFFILSLVFHGESQ